VNERLSALSQMNLSEAETDSWMITRPLELRTSQRIRDSPLSVSQALAVADLTHQGSREQPKAVAFSRQASVRRQATLDFVFFFFPRGYPPSGFLAPPASRACSATTVTGLRVCARTEVRFWEGVMPESDRADGPRSGDREDPDKAILKPTICAGIHRPLLNLGCAKAHRSGSKSGPAVVPMGRTGWVHYPESGWSPYDEIGGSIHSKSLHYGIT